MTEMQEKRYTLAIFDFDGTLARSEACIAASLGAALLELRLEGDVDDLRRHIGLPLELIVRRLAGDQLDDSTVRAVVTAFRRHYATFELDLLTLYPEVPAALDALRIAGVEMTIATSKPTASVTATLERLGVCSLFTQVVGEDQVLKGKPDPEMIHTVLRLSGRQASEAIMIGDTTFDIQMAVAAGLASCAVSYGNHTARQLAEAHPTYLVDSPSAIPRVLGYA